MTDPAKFLSQFMSSSSSSRHVHQSRFVLTDFFNFQVLRPFGKISKWQTLKKRFQANLCQVATVVIIHDSLVSYWQLILIFQVYVHSEN